MRNFSLLLSLMLAGTLAVHSQGRPSADLSPLKFLLGEWVAEGGGSPGEATGEFSHTMDLQGSVMVRRNHADYPATAARPAFSHDDLMIVFGAAGGSLQAEYFDNEGHVIHYAVHVCPSGDSAVFVSEASLQAPRFRFTYIKEGADTLKTLFEIAPPGKPEAFSLYVAGVAHRKQQSAPGRD